MDIPSGATSKLIKAVEDNDLDSINQILEHDDKSVEESIALHYFLAMKVAIRLFKEDICHLLLDHMEKIWSENHIRHEIWKHDIIYRAAEAAAAANHRVEPLTALVERMVSKVGAAKCSVPRNSPLPKAVIRGNLDTVKVLIKAGARPNALFEHSFFNASFSKAIVEQLLLGTKTQVKNAIWKLMIAPLSVEDVFSSELFNSLFRAKNGGLVLSALEQLGLDFAHVIASCNNDVKECMKAALLNKDISTVSFLLAHGFHNHHTPVRELAKLLGNGELTDETQVIWALIVPQLTPREVFSSELLLSKVCEERGGSLLSDFELIGVEFTTYIASLSREVGVFVKRVLDENDLSSMKFLLDHGLDIDTSVVHAKEECFTAFFYILKYCKLSESSEAMDLMVELLKRGANPHIENDSGLNAEDFCMLKIESYVPPQNYAAVLGLLLHMGHALAAITRASIRSMPCLEKTYLVRAIDQVPSLQCICRKTICCEKKAKVNKFMDQLDYPQQLKDFVLFANLDWREFRPSKESVSTRVSDIRNYFESSESESDSSSN